MATGDTLALWGTSLAPSGNSLRFYPQYHACAARKAAHMYQIMMTTKGRFVTSARKLLAAGFLTTALAAGTANGTRCQRRRGRLQHDDTEQLERRRVQFGQRRSSFGRPVREQPRIVGEQLHREVRDLGRESRGLRPVEL